MQVRVELPGQVQVHLAGRVGQGGAGACTATGRPGAVVEAGAVWVQHVCQRHARNHERCKGGRLRGGRCAAAAAAVPAAAKRACKVHAALAAAAADSQQVTLRSSTA
eukprot:365403-Chlamydomonas_euryale.AAC.4